MLFSLRKPKFPRGPTYMASCFLLFTHILNGYKRLLLGSDTSIAFYFSCWKEFWKSWSQMVLPACGCAGFNLTNARSWTCTGDISAGFLRWPFCIHFFAPFAYFYMTCFFRDTVFFLSGEYASQISILLFHKFWSCVLSQNINVNPWKPQEILFLTHSV